MFLLHAANVILSGNALQGTRMSYLVDEEESEWEEVSPFEGLHFLGAMKYFRSRPLFDGVTYPYSVFF